MKQLAEMFTDLFTALQVSVEETNFFACANISSDLIKLSELADFKDGVFIGEVFDCVFNQIRPLVNVQALDSKEIDKFKKAAKKYISIIAENYQNPDKNEVYEALKNIRNDVTILQLKNFRHNELKQHGSFSHDEA